MAAFTIEDLSFTYPTQEEPALSSVSLRVERGEFLTVCGLTGCGKSTLLRHLKPALIPVGIHSGSVRYEGVEMAALSPDTAAAAIGFVQQDPERQIITDQVWHEMAYGLENLGWDAGAIRRRCGETASYLGIGAWWNDSTGILSGGQKQLLNLAAILAMEPKALVLDEPTAQLDPIAAEQFLELLKKINREFATTIVLSEHRLEQAFALSDRVAVLSKGRLLQWDEPGRVCRALEKDSDPMRLALPAAAQIFFAAQKGGDNAPIPLSVRQGKTWLNHTFPVQSVPQAPIEEDAGSVSGQEMLRAEHLAFRFGRQEKDVLRDLSLTLHRGERFALLGGNGAGKTTVLQVLCGLRRPWRGHLKRQGKTILLPQNPEELFVSESVAQELALCAPKDAAKKMAQELGLWHYRTVHPYDLSGGEKQMLALAKILLLKPQVLLMDEPTKGLDSARKTALSQLLKRLAEEGAAILAVSHDMEFCADFDRCALLFDGGIVSAGTPRAFFSGNRYYTTAVDRMTRDVFPGTLTVAQAIEEVRRG